MATTTTKNTAGSLSPTLHPTSELVGTTLHIGPSATTASSILPVHTTTMNSVISTINSTTIESNITTEAPYLPEIFLQTTAAKVVAGIFAFGAIIITVHQVSEPAKWPGS